MTEQVDPGEEIEVNSEGVRVQKSFESDEFPVPAIRFLIQSKRDEAASIRLAEPIPEEFPMDGVGFHPDYESDNWTAFEDHHVEYTRQLEPGESVETVYGIRVGDPEEARPFLTKPDVHVESNGESPTATDEPIEADDEALANTMIEEIASESNSQAVKDMIANDESIPGLDEPDESDTSDEGGGLDLDLGTDDKEWSEDPPEVDFGDTDSPDDEESEEASGIDLDVGGEAETEADEPEPVESDEEIDIDLEGAAETEEDTGAIDPDVEESESEVETETVDSPSGTDDDSPDQKSSADEDPEEVTTQPVESSKSVAEQLAEELRSDEVSDEDRQAIKTALDLEPEPSSVESARVEHLQSRVEDVAAYAEALEEFLDEEGTAQEMIEGFRSTVEELQQEIQEMDEAVSDIDESVSGIDEAVSDIDEDVSNNDEKITSVQSDLESTDNQVEELSNDLTAVETQADDLRTELDAVDEEVGSVTSDLASLEESLEEVQQELEGIQEWRSQLGEMFTGN